MPISWNGPDAISASATPATTTDAFGAPFRIEHERLNIDRAGRFTPSAKLVVTPALRTSGLLAALPGEEVKSLLLLLTFLTANGQVQPNLPQIAGAMGVSEKKARERMLRLLTFVWQGRGPLVREVPRGVGGEDHEGEIADTYRPAPYVIDEVVGTSTPYSSSSDSLHPRAQGQRSHQDQPVRDGNRDNSAAVRFSRATYGRPRAAVERQILEQLGAADSAGSDGEGLEAEARRKLRAYGVETPQSERLLLRYGPERVLRQVGWMRYRIARNPAGFLVAAIEKDYAPPPVLATFPRITSSTLTPSLPSPHSLVSDASASIADSDARSEMAEMLETSKISETPQTYVTGNDDQDSLNLPLSDLAIPNHPSVTGG